MALGYLDDSKLYAIASAIRAKTGDSATMSVDDMPDEIGSISTGAQVEPLSVTENGTYSAPTGYAYTPVTVNVSGGGGITADEIAMKTISGTVAGSASYVANSAFCEFSQLTTASFPSATTIGMYAFASCSRLMTVNFPNATTIGGNAFASCSQLATVSFPSATSISTYAFFRCSQLTTASIPNATTIGSNAFQMCINLKTASFSNVTTISNYAFASCSRLTTASFSAATSIGGYAFAYCSQLATVSFPSATSIGSSAFYSCSLTVASFPAVERIYANAFRSCRLFVELHLEGVLSVPLLSGSSHFMSTPIGGYSTEAGRYGSVFVPASLYNSFLTATNWSSISSRIVSVS